MNGTAKKLYVLLLYIGLLVSAPACVVDDEEPVMEGATEGSLTTPAGNGTDPSSPPDRAVDLKPRAIARMQDALERYRSIQEEGGWPEIPEGKVLDVGERAPRVIALRERLAATGDLPESAASRQDSVYSEQLAAAVASFQKRHGLVVDSLLGPNTVAALNTPVEDRISQMETNLQRLRELPDSMGTRFVFVNIPEFKLRAFDQGQEALEMAVIVGEAYEGQQTPLFDDVMEYVIFRPYWNVPDDIAREEVVPEARGNLEYLRENDFEIVSNWGPDAEVMDYTSANLSKVASGALKLRQKPGPENALGLVKFMFPNEYAIYLHGTPEDQLFEEATRTFSHGSIRVERPVDLAQFVLAGKQGWTRDRIQQAMNEGDWQRVDLQDQIPVYILYLTAYVDDSGTVQFREDVYDLIAEGPSSGAGTANAE